MTKNSLAVIGKGRLAEELVALGREKGLDVAQLNDATAIAPLLRAHGARFVPALAAAEIRSVRSCARPLSADGRPLLGRAPERDGVFVAAGHGPWGISLGPASGRLAADLVLGRGDPPPAAFDPARFV